ncbi:MAG: M20/M25/M40 family metallo-hydrolase [Gemmatimonadetes bacterium]|nr:M20/M25/M40 family metallo-hydrolase [Gemmatimonadota bacterium]
MGTHAVAPMALDPLALASALVAVDSRNPSLVPGAPGEGACAHRLAEILAGWGFRVTEQEVAPGRWNVVARVGPEGHAPLLLNGHLDVVGTEGMAHAPFTPATRDGRLYGRGSADMKGGLAAMCVAAARAAQRGALAAEVIVAAVCDEEFGSIGTAALLEALRQEGIAVAGAVVTEPTRLAVVPVHKGFAFIEVTVTGRAAHGSRYDLGRDANRDAAAFLMAVERHELTVLTRRTHPRLGRASIHAGRVAGGTGWSTYAPTCVVGLERRTLPGESAAEAFAEIEAVCAAVAAERPGFQATARLLFSQPPLGMPEDAPLVAALRAAGTAAGEALSLDGLPCWTDAALLHAAGIPTVCFGPGDIGVAHADTEWVPVDELHRATAVLEALCAGWGRA